MLLRYINKTKMVVILLVIVIITFLGMVALIKKAANYTPTIKAVYCIKEADRKTKLDPKSFELKDIPITQVTKDTVLSMSQINDMYASENIYPNEFLNKNRIAKQNEIDSFTLNPNEREISISFSNIDAVVGGTIRKDDLVDLTFTNTPSTKEPDIVTKTLVEKVRVLGTIDSTGKYVDKLQTNVPANTLLLAVTPEKGAIIDNSLPTGKIRVWKVPEDGMDYNPITVIDGKQVDGNLANTN